MTDPSRSEILDAIERSEKRLAGQITGVHARLDKLNDRVRKNQEGVARNDERIKVNERRGAASGAAAGGAAGGLALLFQYLWMKLTGGG